MRPVGLSPFVAVLAAACFGCATQADSESCDPLCLAGTHCGPDRDCVADEEVPDLATAPDLAATCTPLIAISSTLAFSNDPRYAVVGGVQLGILTCPGRSQAIRSQRGWLMWEQLRSFAAKTRAQRFAIRSISHSGSSSASAKCALAVSPDGFSHVDLASEGP